VQKVASVNNNTIVVANNRLSRHGLIILMVDIIDLYIKCLLLTYFPPVTALVSHCMNSFLTMLDTSMTRYGAVYLVRKLVGLYSTSLTFSLIHQQETH
jgi:hypothetical protein